MRGSDTSCGFRPEARRFLKIDFFDDGRLKDWPVSDCKNTETRKGYPWGYSQHT